MPRPVEIRDGAVELGGRPVLRGIDLAIDPGEVVAILGPNGSGKSTLVRSMTGLVPVARGEVRLFETPLPRFREWRRVGFVPQRVTAAGGVPATVREVVSAGRLSRRRLLRPLGRADRRAVDEAIAAVDLAARASESVATLSGGQQQRVLIARALAGEPELLVLDEPTAGVDVESQTDVARALAGLVQRGATLVVVLHELGPLAPLITRTVVMRDGRIAYDGPPLRAFSEVARHADDHHPELARRRAQYAPAVSGPLEPRAGAGGDEEQA